MEEIKVGQLWVSNSSNGECGMVITELLKRAQVRFKGVGRYIGVEFIESTAREAYIHSSFSLATDRPDWFPKIPSDLFIDDSEWSKKVKK